MSIDVIGIITVLASLASAGGLGAVFNLKIKKENKSLKKEIETIKDKEQDDNICNRSDKLAQIDDKINKQGVVIEHIVGLLKDSEFLKLLRVDLDKNLNLKLSITEFDNVEIIYALKNGNKKLLDYCEGILLNNFQLENKDLKINAFHLLKSVKVQMTKEKMLIKNEKDFVKELQNFLLQQIDNFVFNFNSYKMLKNGDRREKFKENILLLQTTIIDNTLLFFEKYK
jgi:hypothetical protein